MNYNVIQTTNKLCLKHTKKGNANLVTVVEVEKLMSGDYFGTVAR